MLAAILLLAGCQKDETKKTVELNVKSVVAMIGETPDYVKANFDATLEHDMGTSFWFTVPTKEVDYTVTFKTTSGVVTSAVIYCSLGSADGQQLYRQESDKINSGISFVTYLARYSKSGGVLMDFSDRQEFWDYVSQNGAYLTLYETWWIENTARVKFTVKGQYATSTKAIEFDIERNEW